MIKFNRVFLQYIQEFYSLYNFSCEIDSHTLFVGDFFSGSTAIMRVLAKIDEDYTGEIFIDNINLKDIKNKDLNLAYLPEKPILFKRKNLFFNLYFPLKIRKINKNDAKNLINDIILEIKTLFPNFLSKFTFNKIDNILNLKIKNLNLSEQKIIALIRAVIRNPKYVLLENFYENLDKEHLPIANFLINKLKATSLIVACEKDVVSNCFDNFNIINLSNNKE